MSAQWKILTFVPVGGGGGHIWWLKGQPYWFVCENCGYKSDKVLKVCPCCGAGKESEDDG